MIRIRKSFHKFEDKFDRCAQRFTFCHPYLAFLSMFIGMPIFILAAVAASTTLMALPMAWLCGWISWPL